MRGLKSVDRLLGLMQPAPANSYKGRQLCHLSAACLLSSAMAWGAGADINWSITPYIWASDTKFDLKAGDIPIGGEVTFDDLLDTTDASFQLVSEAGIADGNWSAFVDLTYLETSDTYKGRFLKVDSESEQWFVDAAIGWWPQGEQHGFNLYGGVRYTDLDDSFHFSLIETNRPLRRLDSDRDFLDGLIGLRQLFQVAERWLLLARADYSTGDSDGIYQLQAVVRYGMGKRRQYGLMAGYRYKEAKFKHDGLKEEFEYKGPLIGFNFRF